MDFREPLQCLLIVFSNINSISCKSLCFAVLLIPLVNKQSEEVDNDCENT